MKNDINLKKKVLKINLFKRMFRKSKKKKNNIGNI